jgi:glycosyltransferase involved in cell wall biosynthesis
VRLLLVNWQCRENPLAGGAEIHLHEIFGRLAARGHEVTLLCGGWDGCAPTAQLDRIEVVRVGTRYTFPFLARAAFRRELAHRQFDLLIEDVNKIPLGTTRWGGPPVVALVPHLFGGTPFQAISVSTADDLAARGIPRGDVAVICPGIDTVGYTPDAADRAPAPTFAYLGRLKRYKGVHHVVRAFAALRHPTATLEIAGAGDYRPVLERLAASLDLGDRVRFLGRIGEAEKRNLLRRAWALLLASPKEGWGITNLEAAASGTPVVASNSPGIRESVRDGETGYLVPHGDTTAMSAAMGRLAADPALVARLGAQARRFAETFTWERAAEETERHLQQVLTSRRVTS